MVDESVKHEPLTRWYAKGAKAPMMVEILECHGNDYWTIEGPDGVFESYESHLYWSEDDAWRAYAEFMEDVASYLWVLRHVNLSDISEQTKNHIAVAYSHLNEGR